MQAQSEASVYVGGLHPRVAWLIQELAPPSPGRVPRDPEQPRHGCLVELKRSRQYDLDTMLSARTAKEQLCKLMQLNNTALHPVAGKKLSLEGPRNSSILKRRMKTQ